MLVSGKRGRKRWYNVVHEYKWSKEASRAKYLYHHHHDDLRWRKRNMQILSFWKIRRHKISAVISINGFSSVLCFYSCWLVKYILRIKVFFDILSILCFDSTDSTCWLHLWYYYYKTHAEKMTILIKNFKKYQSNNFMMHALRVKL